MPPENTKKPPVRFTEKPSFSEIDTDQGETVHHDPFRKTGRVAVKADGTYDPNGLFDPTPSAERD